jgi:hypothetical protein
VPQRELAELNWPKAPRRFCGAGCGLTIEKKKKKKKKKNRIVAALCDEQS